MKFFTPDEANEALALVRPAAERLVAVRRRHLRAAGRLERIRATVSGNGGGLDPAALERLERAAAREGAAVAAAVAELERLGVQVKDLDRGLVDFPAVHPADGSTVLLCWHVDEDEIAYWHGLEEGFAGRKPLPF